MSSSKKMVFFFITLSTMVCSVTCDRGVSTSYPAYGFNGQSARSSHHHVTHKRALRSTDDVVVLECNGRSEWNCVCYGCDDVRSPPCCLTSVESAMLNESVVIVVGNVTYDDFKGDAEIKIKQSISGVLSNYCTTSGTLCQPAPDLGTAMSPLDGATWSLLTADHVIFVELAQIPDRQLMSIRFFVLGPGDVVVPGDLIQKALTQKKTDLEVALQMAVVEVKVAPQADDSADQSELPVKAIIAGTVLGFFLGLSCVVSAVKAVRDRRLIKERNLAKRERKRQQELRDSIRRSPLKQKLQEYAGKSQSESTASNGDVRTPSLSSQMVHVVVHTSNESLNGKTSPNGRASADGGPSPNGRLSPNGGPAFSDGARRHSDVITQGEVHVPPTSVGSTFVADDGEARRSSSADDAGASDDVRQGAAPDAAVGVVAPSVGESDGQSVATRRRPSADDGGPSVADPRPTGSRADESNPERIGTPKGSPAREIQTPRPGLVNPAYDGPAD